MATPTAQQAAKYGITFSTGSAATPAGVANAAANGIVNNVQQAPSGDSVAPAMQNTGSGVGTQVATPTLPLPVSPVPTQPISTAQPNPTTVNATPFTQGLADMQASGVPPPQENGRGAVAEALATPTFYKPDPNSAQVVNSKGEKLSYDQYLAQGGKADFSNTKQGGPPPPASNTPLHPIEQQLADDPGYQQLLADRAEYNSVANQSKSLLDFYNQAVKDAGITAINAELINTKQIIEGTEDDIRNEVKAASGFATDSQVLALAQARNKSLIKNYNALLDTKSMAMEQINNMVNLAGQDRAFALQSITQKLQIDQQIMDYKDKFVRNAKEGYQNYINAVGYTGLYNSMASDPASLAIAERTLGLPAGTIQQAASQERAAQQAKQAQQTFENSIKSAELNISKRNSDISAGHLALDRAKFAADQANINNPNVPTSVTGKPLTQAESKALGFGVRTLQAAKTINDLGPTFAQKKGTPNISLFGMGLTPNVLKSSEQQKYEQAKRDFVNAVLRQESGAAIGKDEFDSAEKQYFPQYGDNLGVVSQKTTNRNIAIQNLLREGGQGNVNPSTLTLTPDGQLVQIIN